MRHAFLPALLVSSVLLAGCSGDKKNPAGPGQGQPPAYSRATPQATLTSLINAYVFRDSAEYRKLHSIAYVGASYDTSDAPGPQPGTFTYADEVNHIKALAADPYVYRVIMFFGSPSTWTRYPATGPMGEAWAEIAIHSPVLEIDAVNNSYWLASNETLTFQFSPDTSSTSPTDTVWSIVRWYEDGP
jgi:hypothetical protein